MVSGEEGGLVSAGTFLVTVTHTWERGGERDSVGAGVYGGIVGLYIIVLDPLLLGVGLDAGVVVVVVVLAGGGALDVSAFQWVASLCFLSLPL